MSCFIKYKNDARNTTNWATVTIRLMTYLPKIQIIFDIVNFIHITHKNNRLQQQCVQYEEFYVLKTFFQDSGHNNPFIDFGFTGGC